jgi:hypothetical protein
MENNIPNFQFPIELLESVLSKKAENQGSVEVELKEKEKENALENKPKADPGYVEIPDIGGDITEFLIKKEPGPTREDKEQKAQQIGLI